MFDLNVMRETLSVVLVSLVLVGLSAPPSFSEEGETEGETCPIDLEVITQEIQDEEGNRTVLEKLIVRNPFFEAEILPYNGSWFLKSLKLYTGEDQDPDPEYCEILDYPMDLGIPSDSEAWITHYDCSKLLEITFFRREEGEKWELQIGLDPVIRFLANQEEEVKLFSSQEEFFTHLNETFYFQDYPEEGELQEGEEYQRGMHYLYIRKECSSLGVRLGLITEPRASARLLVGRGEPPLIIEEENQEDQDEGGGLANYIGLSLEGAPETSNGVTQYWLVVDPFGTGDEEEDQVSNYLERVFLSTGIKKRLYLEYNGTLLEGENQWFTFDCSNPELDQESGISWCPQDQDQELKLILRIRNEHYFPVEVKDLDLEGPYLIADGKDYSLVVDPLSSTEIIEEELESLEETINLGK